MKVTVKDCLQLDVFKQCVVVAGESKLDNRVRTVSVMDDSTVDEAIKHCGKKDEMILTTFAGMKKDIEAQQEVIRQLAKNEVAAVVVFQMESSSGENQSYPDVMRAAEEAALPLIILIGSRDIGYSRVITEVMEKVLYGSNFNNSLINNTIFHLLNFEKHSNFQQALREAAINNDFQVVLMSEEFNPILTVETRYKTTVEAAIRRGKDVALNFNGVYSLVDIDGVLVYWGAIEIKGDKYYLLIVDNDDNYSSGEITKLAEIIELAMGMWKFTPERDAKTEFVKSLIRGNKSLAYSLKDEAGVKSEDILSVFYARGIESSEEDRIVNSFEEKGLLHVIRIKEGEESYGVLIKGTAHIKHEDTGEKSICVKFFDELKENKRIRIFHVTGIGSIEGAGDGFRLINETWSSVGGIFPYKRVFTKYDLALVSNCINLQAQGGYLKKNFMDLLEDFKVESDNKSKQMLETLETFVLDAGMNSGKTAEFMGIHTNTVQYRLKKINEVLGVEITGNRVIPGLTIALALRRLEKNVN